MKEGAPIHSSRGRFVISLDYEQYWGVRDIMSLADYRKLMSGERTIIPMLLKLFEQYEVHATWATVGLLFASTREEMLAHMPSNKPSYTNNNLSPYNYMMENVIGGNETVDDDHYGQSLIETIRNTKYQ